MLSKASKAKVVDDKVENGGPISGNNTYHPGVGDGVEDVEFDELHVVCPPHTTERKIVSRIDLRLMPFICIMYLLAFLDRVNIANAKSFSLVADLGLTGTEYNTGTVPGLDLVYETERSTQTDPD
ncbi:hypothetical protein JX265_007498 [Neoarthrinium moseri]|uniref:Uncharacterized protein n=1 Tax=Neoarthrinium moseri TaxID=1658444 RepID=A0A9Q0APJ0_9PEZI|nr:uncharacterized protein JN550_000088 [Neoarthrinium moseri]KAI1854633.1 hypothetical protein JX266_000751 [Neoarthrinium moseri]KAI1866922.1 hypothetical protein JX265_007498 [Neoarthrinium moseri]KAI1877906.1 hypothetical protein JN550_000088 [Neoarthrinium moseri]